MEMGQLRSTKVRFDVLTRAADRFPRSPRVARCVGGEARRASPDASMSIGIRPVATLDVAPS